jgi:catechol 2,3-dioxygenase-like lactoylglutathione lyase family enzyme
MKLGVFSISLSVKDLEKSIQFYKNLGFTQLGGDVKQNYVILKNEKAIIGLFQGMFEGNILTFNPGWDENAKEINPFDDIRTIQHHLLENGISIDQKIDQKTSGPASLTIQDPDGNIILIDQHR